MPFLNLGVGQGFTSKEDSQYFTETYRDPAIRVETEGGYAITRRRYGRAPARLITTGFTDIADAQKVLLMNYYRDLGGAASSFTYIHPISSESIVVRFTKAPVPKYVGMGGNHRWDVPDIELEEI